MQHLFQKSGSWAGDDGRLGRLVLATGDAFDNFPPKLSQCPCRVGCVK
jgi:hypothetical protein